MKTLSEKIMDINHVKMLQVIEVIEFIKKLKDELKAHEKINWKIVEKIDELAGEKLK